MDWIMDWITDYTTRVCGPDKELRIDFTPKLCNMDPHMVAELMIVIDQVIGWFAKGDSRASVELYIRVNGVKVISGKVNSMAETIWEEKNKE